MKFKQNKFSDLVHKKCTSSALQTLTGYNCVADWSLFMLMIVRCLEMINETKYVKSCGVVLRVSLREKYEEAH